MLHSFGTFACVYVQVLICAVMFTQCLIRCSSAGFWEAARPRGGAAPVCSWRQHWEWCAALACPAQDSSLTPGATQLQLLTNCFAADYLVTASRCCRLHALLTPMACHVIF